MRAMLLSATVVVGLAAAAGAKDISGTPNDDFLDDPEADRIEGLGGHDEILAHAVDEPLDGGGDGDDVANGSEGNDQIDGWGGNDALTGGRTATCCHTTHVSSKLVTVLAHER